jgi:hypothetical protein
MRNLTFRSIQGHSPYLSRRLSISNAFTLIRQSLGTSNLLEAHIRVVRILKPVEPPVAPSLEFLGEAVASRALGDAAVLLAPALRGRTPLACASVEDADAATWKIVSKVIDIGGEGLGLPGIAISKWLFPRSPPVLVVCTIIFLPLTGPEVNVNLRMRD